LQVVVRPAVLEQQVLRFDEGYVRAKVFGLTVEEEGFDVFVLHALSRRRYPFEARGFGTVNGFLRGRWTLRSAAVCTDDDDVVGNILSVEAGFVVVGEVEGEFAHAVAEG